MKNYWLDKKLRIAVIERNGNEIRFTLSNSHVWKFKQPDKGVIEYSRLYPVLTMENCYALERKLCREKAWDIFNGKITSSQQV